MDTCDVLIVRRRPGRIGLRVEAPHRPASTSSSMDKATSFRATRCAPAGSRRRSSTNCKSTRRLSRWTDASSQSPDSARDWSARREAVETAYDHPVSFGIRRCEFDHYLLQRSEARLRLGRADREHPPGRAAVGRQRRDQGADARRRRRSFLSGGRTAERAPIGDAPVVAAQEVEFADRSTRGCFRIHDRARDTRALLLPRSQGLRLVLSETATT